MLGRGWFGRQAKRLLSLLTKSVVRASLIVVSLRGIARSLLHRDGHLSLQQAGVLGLTSRVLHRGLLAGRDQLLLRV